MPIEHTVFKSISASEGPHAFHITVTFPGNKLAYLIFASALHCSEVYKTVYEETVRLHFAWLGRRRID